MSNLVIADTIRQQLLAGNQNKIRVMCWGATKWVAGEKCLSFKVSARRHKGYVKITLNAMDTYDVQLLSTHGNEKKKWNGLYFDQLAEVIDNEIENVKENKF